MQASDRGGKPAFSRREFVGKLAAGAAVASAVTITIGQAQAMTRGARKPAGARKSTDQFGPPSGVPQPEIVAHAVEAPAVVGAPPQPVSAPPPWELVRPLAVGSTVAHGWRVADLSGVADGSLVLTLENARGRTHRVHLCRNDGRPQGLVYTNRFDLVVMNGGQGDLPTEEGLAQAVAEVAHVLAANEGDRRQEPVVTALLPHAERVQRFAAAAALR